LLFKGTTNKENRGESTENMFTSTTEKFFNVSETPFPYRGWILIISLKHYKKVENTFDSMIKTFSIASSLKQTKKDVHYKLARELREPLVFSGQFYAIFSEAT